MSDDVVAEFSSVSIEITRNGQPFRIAALFGGVPSRPLDVVWLHANGFNALTYRSILTPLVSRLNILAVDQRGHGATPQEALASAKRDALDMRDDLLGLLAVIAPQRPVILAGHSLGGCVSLLAAAEAPSAVRGLALFDPVVLSRDAAQSAMSTDGSALSEAPLVQKARARRRRFRSREAAFNSYRGRAIFASWPEAAVRDYVEAGFRDHVDGDVELACAPEWEAANFAAHGHDIWDAMSRIEAPIRIYRADQGSTCAITEGSQFPRPSAQVRVTTVPHASHFLPIERPDVVQACLLQLAAETELPGR